MRANNNVFLCPRFSNHCVSRADSPCDLLGFQAGNQIAASLVARGTVKNVVDDGGIDCWGSFAKLFSTAFGGHPSLWGFGYSFDRCSLTNLRSVFSEYDSRSAFFCFRLTAGKSGKSPHVTRRGCECLSKTLDRRAESFPRRTARNPTAPLNFLPRIAFQTTEDDILRDFIAACKGLR